MALTEETVMHRAWNLATSQGVVPQDFPRERVVPLISEGLYRTATQAVSDEDYREFQTTVTDTVATGSCTLTDTTLILDTIPAGRVSISTTAYYFAKTYDDLRAAMALTDAGWYTMEGRTLKFKDAAGSLTGATGTVTIVACRVPTLANLPARFEPRLIEEIVGLMAGQQERRKDTPAKVVLTDATTN